MIQGLWFRDYKDRRHLLGEARGMVAGHDLSLKDTFLCMTGDLAAFLKTVSAPARPHDVMMLFCERNLLIDQLPPNPAPILLFLNRKRKRSGSGLAPGHKPIESG
ncbi:hypothetical protein SAMN05216417_11252 [Nitrosospira multiformis]|uniref:Uncharacterized protein n=1 Tax=Nitrosospira multiformis TaxID=1231 RepID=A0A1I7HWH5_9PROT|nr:hypothetical protein SAMN05216417_11252 [Nitrosospira multiformis]